MVVGNGSNMLKARVKAIEVVPVPPVFDAFWFRRLKPARLGFVGLVGFGIG